MTYQKLDELEEEYRANRRKLQERTDQLDDWYRNFHLRVDHLIDEVYDAYQGLVDVYWRDIALHQLQDSLEQCHRDYNDEKTQLEERRFEMTRQFNHAYEGLYQRLQAEKWGSQPFL